MPDGERSPTIDVATEADGAAVVALWQACGLTRPWNDPAMDFALATGEANAAILVARDAGAPCGTIMVGFDGHRGWVYYLGVAPDHRRIGLGRALITAAETWLRDRGAPKLQLMVRGDNRDAHGFYEALGYARQDVVVFGRVLGGAGA